MIYRNCSVFYGSPMFLMSHILDVVRVNGGERAVHGGTFGERALPVWVRGWHDSTDVVVGRQALWPPQRSRGDRPTLWARGSASLSRRCIEDNAPYQRHDCGDAKRGRALCPHTAVNGRAARHAFSDLCNRRGVNHIHYCNLDALSYIVVGKGDPSI